MHAQHRRLSFASILDMLVRNYSSTTNNSSAGGEIRRSAAVTSSRVALRTELCSRRVFSWSIDLLVRNNSSATILDLLVRGETTRLPLTTRRRSAWGEIWRSADNACTDAQVKARICLVARGSVLMVVIEALSLSVTKKPVHKGMLCIVRVCKFACFGYACIVTCA